MVSDEIIKSVLDWNPWLTGEFPKKLSGVKREINLIDYLKTKEIKILEGARRVGKSTLMFQVIEEVLKLSNKVIYLNFDDEVLKKHDLSKIYETILEKQQIEYLFIDEIQNCNNWVHFVRKLYDLQKLKQIWITGSNSSLIQQEYSTLLTGRNLTIKISSLNFKEFLSFKSKKYNLNLLSTENIIEIKQLFNEYLEFGAFPEIVLKEVNKKEILINYFEDFIYKDIVARYNINAQKIKELGLYLTSNNTKFVSYRNLSSALGLNYNSVVDYINYFCEIYLFDFLHEFNYSLKKQLLQMRKIYSIDTGISNSVSFKFSDDIGRQLENLVFLQFKRKNLEIYYHKDKFECDFLIKNGLEIIQAVQVTKSLSDEEIKKRELNGLIEACKKYKLKEGLILTQDEEFIENEDDGIEIKVLPIWKWLLVENQ